jgi:hypothetical protein
MEIQLYPVCCLTTQGTKESTYGLNINPISYRAAQGAMASKTKAVVFADANAIGPADEKTA